MDHQARIDEIVTALQAKHPEVKVRRTPEGASWYLGRHLHKIETFKGGLLHSSWIPPEGSMSMSMGSLPDGLPAGEIVDQYIG